MLPCGTAFMHLYGMFNLRLLFHFFFLQNLYTGIETPDRNGQWYQHLQTLLPFFIFMTAIQKRLTFGLCLYVLCLCHVHVLYKPCRPDMTFAVDSGPDPGGVSYCPETPPPWPDHVPPPRVKKKKDR